MRIRTRRFTVKNFARLSVLALTVFAAAAATFASHSISIANPGQANPVVLSGMPPTCPPPQMTCAFASDNDLR